MGKCLGNRRQLNHWTLNKFLSLSKQSMDIIDLAFCQNKKKKKKKKVSLILKSGFIGYWCMQGCKIPLTHFHLRVNFKAWGVRFSEFSPFLQFFFIFLYLNKQMRP